MFNKKAFLRWISIGMTFTVLAGAGLMTGCTTFVQDNVPPAAEESKQDKIMSEFTSLAEGDPKPDTIIEFMDKNIAEVSRENASIIFEELEKVQKNNLSELEEKYYKESIQKTLSEIYMKGFDLDKIYDTEDAELKSLLKETRDMGYKVETAEGMFYPVMNYAYLKKFSSYAEEDMKDYIDIMAVETDKTPAKDGALVIGWDEVVERALAQEGFIKKHGSSAKAEDIKALHKRYITFMLYGLNNTPLFSYDTKGMDPEAKEAYTKVLKDKVDSELLQLLGKYMEILGKSDYKLSEEADKFRKDAVETGDNM
jgi:hypothetical protein